MADVTFGNEPMIKLNTSEYTQSTTTPTVPVASTMTTAEANQVLNNYGVDPTKVLSAANVSNTVSNPTVAPDDLLGIRANITKELGLDTQQTAYQNALAAARAKVNELNKTSAIMEGNRVNMGVIRGEQAQARNLAAPEIERLQYQSALEADKLNALTQERDYRVGVAEKNIDFTRSLKLQYPGAKINFGDSMDTVESKLVSYQKEKKKEAEKDALKSALRQLGLKTSGSTKELEKRLSKYSKSAAKEAKQIADLQLEKMRMEIQNTKSLIAERNSASTTGGNNASIYYGDNINQGTSGQMSANQSGYAGPKYNDPLGSFGY